jgi:outer membrane autotransporter protein
MSDSWLHRSADERGVATGPACGSRTRRFAPTVLLASMVFAVFGASGAFAACSDHSPASGETVTCDTSAPNPDPVNIVAAPGSTNVTINVLPGSGIDITGNSGIRLQDQSLVNNHGAITETGDVFDGITVDGSSNSVTNTGSITTNGFQSEGIFTTGNDNTFLNDAGGSITTNGGNSDGMLVFGGGTGNTLINRGTITTFGFSFGLEAQGDNNTLMNSGTIRTLSTTFAAAGIGTTGTNNQLINSGQIATSGPGAHGLFANGNTNTLINMSPGIISTVGSGAFGLFASGSGNGLTNAGTITTTGDDAVGLGVSGVGNTLTTLSASTITTHGADAHGIEADGDNNTITNGGTISVSGTDAHGIVSNNATSATVTNTGSITASGSGGLGALLGGRATFVNAAGASIVSQQSQAIDMNGGGTFNNAGTITSQQGGISIVGNPVTVTNSGTIRSNASWGILSTGNVDVTIINTGTLIGAKAVWTDTGNDTFMMSAGSTTGLVDLGGGANTVIFTGGTIGQGIETDDGPNTLLWKNGGTINGPVTLGSGNDTATLSGLTDANLAGLTTLDGGSGPGNVLTLDDTQVGGASRFVDWETVNLTNGSQLTLDNRGLTLGNTDTGAGALNIDATSTLLAGGFGDPAIMPAVASRLVNVINAGTIDLTNGGNSTNDALAIYGNYFGNGGRLLLQSVLGADGAPSDKLVIVGGAGAGNTMIGVTNVGGTGGATLANGIMVVQASDGATTTPGAFALPKSLMAGAYVYYLFKGGVDPGTANNWYLRSSLPPAPATPAGTTTQIGPIPAVGTPPLPEPPPPGAPPTPLYRMEVPVYAEVPELVRTLGIEQIGTFHDRQGAQMLLSETGTLPATWVRVWGEHADQQSGGAVDPEFTGTISGVQVGQDLYAARTQSGHQDHFGLFFGYAGAAGNVNGLALGFPNFAAGNLSINAYGGGGYWTHIGPGGWYTDAVITGSSLTISPSSMQGIGAVTHGNAIAASLEGGLPIALPVGLSVEPQGHLIWQDAAVNSLNDNISTVSFRTAGGVVGRLGARVQGQFNDQGTLWQPYASVNFLRNFGGADSATFAGTTAIPVSERATAAQFGLGLVARASTHFSAFVTTAYTTNLGGFRCSDFGGNIGARYSW